MKNLKDKVALVTGASQGIGRETALALARAGCHVIVNARSKTDLEQTAHDIVSLERQSQVIVADLSDRSQIETMCRQALDAFGKIDIVVNNAATRLSGRLENISIEDWKSMMDVNLWAYIEITKLLLPPMLERREGHFVYLSSVSGFWGLGLMLPYATSKYAIVGFGEALAAQVRSSGIGVTVVCPGFVKTRVFDSYQITGNEEAQARATRAREWLRSKYVMEPDRVAKKIVKGIRRNRFFLLTHPESRLFLWGRVMFPNLLARFNAWITDRILPR